MIGAIISFVLGLLGKYLSKPAVAPVLLVEEKTDAKVEAAADAEHSVAVEQLRGGEPSARQPDPFSRD
jgi:hypothetical protein